MNILILSWRGLGHPNAGGAEKVTFEHAQGWIKAGHQVTIFTSYFPGGKRREIINGVTILRRGRQIFGVQLEAFKWYLFASHDKFDLVVDEFHGIPFFTPLYVKTKKLAFIHEVTKEVWKYNSLPPPLNFLPAVLGTIFEPFIFKFFYKNVPFMTVSESTKKDLIAWNIKSDHIIVIPNGITVLKNRQYTKNEKSTLIYLGVLSQDKGIEDALKVFSWLKKQKQGWNFWIVGKAGRDYVKQLKNECKKLNIDGDVRFWGYVDEHKKFELLQRSHLLLNPSVREGWGLVIIEAAAVGTPSVGYNVAGLRDSIVDGKTGFLCGPNPIACGKKILLLLNDPDTYEKFSKNCIVWSKKFDWKVSIQKSSELIGKL